jgi:hypothetical protein
VQGEAGDEGSPATDRVGHGADEELAEGQTGQRAGERQLDGGGRGLQVGRDGRQRRQVHVDGQRPDRDEQAEDHDERGPFAPIGIRVGRGCLALHDSAHEPLPAINAYV